MYRDGLHGVDPLIRAGGPRRRSLPDGPGVFSCRCYRLYLPVAARVVVVAIVAVVVVVGAVGVVCYCC